MRCIYLTLLGLVLVSAAAAGLESGSAKPAWTLPDAERLAVRFDPDRARARQARAEAEDGPQPSPAAPGLQMESCAVDGRFHPELFLPFELFNRLTKLRFAPMDEELRSGYLIPIEDRLPSYGFGEDFGEEFWRRLEKVARGFILLQVEDFEILRKSQAAAAARGGKAPPAEPDQAARVESGLRMCRERARALAATRTEFGAEPFDRFLYEVIAPPMFSVSACGPERQAEMAFVAGGCR